MGSLRVRGRCPTCQREFEEVLPLPPTKPHELRVPKACAQCRDAAPPAPPPGGAGAAEASGDGAAKKQKKGHRRRVREPPAGVVTAVVGGGLEGVRASHALTVLESVRAALAAVGPGASEVRAGVVYAEAQRRTSATGSLGRPLSERHLRTVLLVLEAVGLVRTRVAALGAGGRMRLVSLTEAGASVTSAAAVEAAAAFHAAPVSGVSA